VGSFSTDLLVLKQISDANEKSFTPASLAKFHIHIERLVNAGDELDQISFIMGIKRSLAFASNAHSRVIANQHLRILHRRSWRSFASWINLILVSGRRLKSSAFRRRHFTGGRLLYSSQAELCRPECEAIIRVIRKVFVSGQSGV
jgi:hypothetical protein